MSSLLKHQARQLLVVDDEYFNFEILKAGLASIFDLSYADSGKSCLASAIANPPDIILLDVCMPGLDGYDTCRILTPPPPRLTASRRRRRGVPDEPVGPRCQPVGGWANPG